MKQKICRWLLKRAGWTLGSPGFDCPKSVICVAPHTSNWDFIIGKLFYTAVGKNASFLIKKEWFFFPLNLFFKSINGVPIDRSKKGSTVEQMCDEFARREEFHLAITPEATRKRRETWKTGFYLIAQQAGVPIELAKIDFEKKYVGIDKLFESTGNMEKDILNIRLYYEDAKGKNPNNFAYLNK